MPQLGSSSPKDLVFVVKLHRFRKENCMSGIRLDRLLTSTAILLCSWQPQVARLPTRRPPTRRTTPAPGNTPRPPRPTRRSSPTNPRLLDKPCCRRSRACRTGPRRCGPAAPAAAEAPVAAPATIVAASPDAPIADQLHNLASGKFDQIIGNKQVRRRSTLSIPDAITRRSGSPTARPMRAPLRPSPISAMSMPTGSIPPIIRCRISPRSAIRRRLRMPKSS